MNNIADKNLENLHRKCYESLVCIWCVSAGVYLDSNFRF